MITTSRSETNPAVGQFDDREQLCNGREIGPFHQVSLPVVNITSLHGILFDLDLNLFRVDGTVPIALDSVEDFAARTLRPMLDRHPALRGAEVRDTGRNIHAIVWFDQPVGFENDADRTRWESIVEIVQAALPIDPDAPGITALTRPVGSINSKTDRPVRILEPGTPVPVADVLKLHDEIVRAPFRTVAGILFGSDRISPCPSCCAAGSSLRALDRDGQCYGSCGRVKLERLYDAFLVPREIPVKKSKEVENASR